MKSIFYHLIKIHFPTKEGSFLIFQEKFFKIHKIEFKRKFFLKIFLNLSAKLKNFFIDENVTFNESNNFAIKKTGQLIVGKNTYITRATIACFEKIEIGENCILGEGLKIFDHNHQYTTEPFEVSKLNLTHLP
jgi:acetyltransferase-like isoleucine patch superfamily enzyme